MRYFLTLVEPLSNLRLPRDVSEVASRPVLPGLELRKAHRHEIHAALQMILGGGGDLAGEEQVVDFLRFAVYRGIDLNDTWVANDKGRVIWAILPVVSPGKTMLLFAPTHVPSDVKDTAARPLVEMIVSCFRGRAIDLAQVLIDPSERPALSVFADAGFERLAELVYLDREVRKSHDVTVPPGMSWRTYAAATHEQFTRAIAASYEQSLDCPRLNGIRQMEDVIAGHKAAGEFDPKLWFLLCNEQSEPLGVMLLNRSSRTDALELVYLGLARPARGRGLGDVMMRHALASAALIGSRRLTLAVDSDNKPALRLYHRHGLSKVCSRVALIRDLRN